MVGSPTQGGKREDKEQCSVFMKWKNEAIPQRHRSLQVGFCVLPQEKWLRGVPKEQYPKSYQLIVTWIHGKGFPRCGESTESLSSAGC